MRRLDDLVSALLSSPVLAGFCYTQLTDTEQERNGLLTADRLAKADPAEIRAILTKIPDALSFEEVSALRDEAVRKANADGSSRAK